MSSFFVILPILIGRRLLPLNILSNFEPLVNNEYSLILFLQNGGE